MYHELFAHYIHDSFYDVAQKLDDAGFLVGVVGGTSRDFLLRLPNKHDYDCEIRPKVSAVDFEATILKIQDMFAADFQTEILRYNVLRLKGQGIEVELSFPRVETFNDEFSHSNFEVEFIEDQDFKQGFKRRDFTVNAIMFLYRDKAWQLVDPFDGATHIKDELLVQCSNDFEKDPVRFLRAMRFELTLDFDLEMDMFESIKDKTIEDFPAHYIISEANKTEFPLYFIFKFVFLLDHGLSSDELIMVRDIDRSYKSEYKLSDAISSLYFLDNSLIIRILRHLGLSLKKTKVIKFPIELKRYTLSMFEVFYKTDKNLLNDLQSMYELPENVYEIYHKKKYIDVKQKTLGKIFAVEVEFPMELMPEMKSYYKFYKQLEFFLSKAS